LFTPHLFPDFTFWYRNWCFLDIIKRMSNRWVRILTVLIPLAVAVLLFLWLAETPAGLLGKMDAIGYAVCHRIDARSFHLGDRQLPLCARCSGMYLGALIGLFFQLPLSPKAGLPTKKVSLVLLVFLVAFGVDGVNSYLQLIPNAPSLYNPANPLRLLTGTMLGVGLMAVLLPTFRQVIWAEPDPAPVLHSWRQIGALVGLAVLVDLIVLWENPLLLYPLAILSSLTVPLILSMVYAILLTMLVKRENQARHWTDLWLILVAAAGMALLQIALVDWIRYALTGTWGGFFAS